MTKNGNVVNEQMRKYKKCLGERSRHRGDKAGQSKHYSLEYTQRRWQPKTEHICPGESQKGYGFRNTKFENRRINATYMHKITTPCHPLNPWCSTDRPEYQRVCHWWNQVNKKGNASSLECLHHPSANI